MEQLDDCLKNAELGRKLVVLWDVNVKIGDQKVEGTVRGWGVPGVNANCEYLVVFSSER